MSRYAEIEPFEQGILDVGDGQQVYWEVCGDPTGKPAVVLHGGPGSGCTPGLRRYFDPGAYRSVLFDQRGAGRSVPHAGAPTVDLSTNITYHLIADIELLREHLGVERWLAFEVSWGTTLALAYAEQHPQRVIQILLSSVTMRRPSDIHWLFHGVGRFLPEEWARFREGVVGGRAPSCWDRAHWWRRDDRAHRRGDRSILEVSMTTAARPLSGRKARPQAPKAAPSAPKNASGRSI